METQKDTLTVQEKETGSTKQQTLPRQEVLSAPPTGIRLQYQPTPAAPEQQTVFWHKNSREPFKVGAQALLQGDHIYTAPGAESLFRHELAHWVLGHGHRAARTETRAGIPVCLQPELEQQADRRAFALQPTEFSVAQAGPRPLDSRQPVLLGPLSPRLLQRYKNQDGAKTLRRRSFSPRQRMIYWIRQAIAECQEPLSGNDAPDSMADLLHLALQMVSFPQLLEQLSPVFPGAAGINPFDLFFNIAMPMLINKIEAALQLSSDLADQRAVAGENSPTEEEMGTGQVFTDYSALLVSLTRMMLNQNVLPVSFWGSLIQNTDLGAGDPHTFLYNLFCVCLTTVKILSPSNEAWVAESVFPLIESHPEDALRITLSVPEIVNLINAIIPAEEAEEAEEHGDDWQRDKARERLLQYDISHFWRDALESQKVSSESFAVFSGMMLQETHTFLPTVLSLVAVTSDNPVPEIFELFVRFLHTAEAAPANLPLPLVIQHAFHSDLFLEAFQQFAGQNFLNLWVSFQPLLFDQTSSADSFSLSQELFRCISNLPAQEKQQLVSLMLEYFSSEEKAELIQHFENSLCSTPCPAVQQNLSLLCNRYTLNANRAQILQRLYHHLMMLSGASSYNALLQELREYINGPMLEEIASDIEASLEPAECEKLIFLAQQVLDSFDSFSNRGKTRNLAMPALHPRHIIPHSDIKGLISIIFYDPKFPFTAEENAIHNTALNAIHNLVALFCQPPENAADATAYDQTIISLWTGLMQHQSSSLQSRTVQQAVKCLIDMLANHPQNIFMGLGDENIDLGNRFDYSPEAVAQYGPEYMETLFQWWNLNMTEIGNEVTYDAVHTVWQSSLSRALTSNRHFHQPEEPSSDGIFSPDLQLLTGSDQEEEEEG